MGNVEKDTETAGASRPQARLVFTLPDCLPVTCCLSLLPVSVPMTSLLTRAGDPSFIRPNYILGPLTEILTAGLTRAPAAACFINPLEAGIVARWGMTPAVLHRTDHLIHDSFC